MSDLFILQIISLKLSTWKMMKRLFHLDNLAPQKVRNIYKIYCVPRWESQFKNNIIVNRTFNFIKLTRHHQFLLSNLNHFYVKLSFQIDKSSSLNFGLFLLHNRKEIISYILNQIRKIMKYLTNKIFNVECIFFLMVI